VLTFDPIGGYRHPDHIYIHEAATKAFRLAGDPGYQSDLPVYQPARLFYHTIPKYFIKFNIRLLKLIGKDPTKYGRNKDIDLTQISVDFPIHAKIDYRDAAEKKNIAAGCHASQGGGGLTRGYMRWIAWLFGARSDDQFMQAEPNPTPDYLLSDLFEGLDE
jgi:LmbE family N-acetylglucosaminyl deacetylase